MGKKTSKESIIVMAKRNTLEAAKNILLEVYKDDTPIVSRIVSAYYDGNKAYIADTLRTLICYLEELKQGLDN